MEAACGECVQMVAPHLRFGVEGDHDPNREAFCALVAEPSFQPAFLYTEEDPSGFTGSEPTDLASLAEAARARCCGEVWGGEGSFIGKDGKPHDGPLDLILRQNGTALTGRLVSCHGGGFSRFSATLAGTALVDVALETGGCVYSGSGTLVGDQMTMTFVGLCFDVVLGGEMTLTRGVSVAPECPGI